MGYVDVQKISYILPDSRQLLLDVSFRVGEGARVALVGPNGAGKTTLLRIIAGDLKASDGNIAHSGGLGVMRQFIGSVRDDSTVRDLVLSVSPPAVVAAGKRLHDAELTMMERDDERSQLAYATAISDWGDAGGYDSEVMWDVCTTSALGLSFDAAANRLVRTLSGGEQKRLVLEALLRGPEETLLLDEPDNYLDVPGKRWLEEQLLATKKTILYVSHDRELLARTANQVVTVEGGGAWVFGGGWAAYHDAKAARYERQAEMVRRWEEERERLRMLVVTLRQQASISPDMANRYHAMQTRYEKYLEVGAPPSPPEEQSLTMRLRGGRTGVRALTVASLELTGLMKPFSLEVFHGERVAVLGGNGSGKSHFLRLLAGQPVKHTGVVKLGARVRAGWFAQTHEHPELMDQTLTEVLWRGDEHREGLDRAKAIGALKSYEIAGQADQKFGSLSGGQQARFQVLLLQLGGATMLLLDEPTDNLDLASAEALQEGLEGYEGTVLAVTHDRWFARGFDRFVVFGSDGVVYEAPEPVWEESRPVRG